MFVLFGVLHDGQSRSPVLLVKPLYRELMYVLCVNSVLYLFWKHTFIIVSFGLQLKTWSFQVL